MAFGPEAGLKLVDAIAGEAALRNYAPLPAARGDFLFRAGRLAEARERVRGGGAADPERARADVPASRGREGCRSQAAFRPLRETLAGTGALDAFRRNRTVSKAEGPAQPISPHRRSESARIVSISCAWVSPASFGRAAEDLFRPQVAVEVDLEERDLAGRLVRRGTRSGRSRTGGTRRRAGACSPRSAPTAPASSNGSSEYLALRSTRSRFS